MEQLIVKKDPAKTDKHSYDMKIFRDYTSISRRLKRHLNSCLNSLKIKTILKDGVYQYYLANDIHVKFL